MDYDQIVKMAKQMQAKQIPLFRVDPNHYEARDIISPKGNYQEGMGIEQQRIEESLARTCPLDVVIQRKDNIFLFDDLKNALLFFKNKTGNANLYKVKVDPQDIVYKGDMNYLDFLLEVVRNTDKKYDIRILDTYAKKYWETGFCCASPCFELMCKEVMVEEKVITKNSERAKRFCLEINKDKYVHLTDTYKALVNNYY